MEEGSNSVVDSTQTTEAAGTPLKPARSKWLRVPLYLLALVGAVVIGAVIYASMSKPTKERLTIDEASMIDSVMTESYGKYSEAKGGWLYVGDDNRTYLMRVIQQVKVPDHPDGDELYFLASGAAIDGAADAMLGVFYIHPNPDKPTELVSVNLAGMHGGSAAVKPEDVHFEALSEQLWGWVVKIKEGTTPTDELVSVNNLVLAPRGNDIVKLAEFPASREYDIGVEGCARAHDTNFPAAATEEPAPAKTAEVDAAEGAAAEPEVTADNVEETEPEGFDLCQKRRWTYRTATVNGNIPVPITVTASGTLDNKPVPAKTWKLVFDTKAFRYNVPEDISQ